VLTGQRLLLVTSGRSNYGQFPEYMIVMIVSTSKTLGDEHPLGRCQRSMGMPCCLTREDGDWNRLAGGLGHPLVGGHWPYKMSRPREFPMCVAAGADISP